MCLVTRNQLRTFLKIRMQVQILTILCELSKHLVIIDNFYSLTILGITNHVTSLFILRKSFRLREVSCSSLFRQTWAQRGYGRYLWHSLKEKAGEAWPGILMLRPQVHAATSCLHPGFQFQSTRLFFWSLLRECLCTFTLLCLLFPSSLLPSLQVVNSQCQSWRQIWPGASTEDALLTFQHH